MYVVRIALIDVPRMPVVSTEWKNACCNVLTTRGNSRVFLDPRELDGKSRCILQSLVETLDMNVTSSGFSE